MVGQCSVWLLVALAVPLSVFCPTEEVRWQRFVHGPRPHAELAVMRAMRQLQIANKTCHERVVLEARNADLQILWLSAFVFLSTAGICVLAVGYARQKAQATVQTTLRASLLVWKDRHATHHKAQRNACTRSFAAWKRLHRDLVATTCCRGLLDDQRLRAERAEAAVEYLTVELSQLTEKLHRRDNMQSERLALQSAHAQGPAPLPRRTERQDDAPTSGPAANEEEGRLAPMWTGLRLTLSRRAKSFPRGLECRINGGRVSLRRASPGGAASMAASLRV